MNIIYIDANIFLGFYNSNRPEYKKLLASVIELADNTFFTQQIANEIDRNKLNVFRQSIENYVKQVSLTATTLPEHMDEESSPKLAEWNKERKELEKQISTSNKNLEPILNEVFNDISVSKDKVSQSLSVLYSKAKQPTNEIIEKARLRKEIGNPPGKRADPLGDQLSWEQLLTAIHEANSVWIVSNDKDYFVQHNKVIFLNPVLYNDLISINPKLQINQFNILSEALREYNKQEQIKAIPSTEELDAIAKTETIDLAGVKGSTAAYLHPFHWQPTKPTICPNCRAENSFSDGGYLRSQYGGLTLQYVCTKCGFHYDTGDSFD